MALNRRLVNTGSIALIGVLAGWAAIAVLTGAVGNRAQAVAAAEIPLPISTVTASYSESYEIALSFVGRIEPRRESEVGFELGGRVAAVRVDEGERVQAGEVIAILDTALLDARRSELVAEQARAQADLDLAIKTRRRIDDLQSLDFASSQARDEATEGVNARRAELNRAEAAIRSVDVQLEKSALLAPYDAVVATREIDEGQVIAAGTPVFRLLEATYPEARIGLSGESLDRLEIGHKYTLLVRGKHLAATLKTVLPTREGQTRNTDAIFRLEVPSHQLRSGDLAKLVLREVVHQPVIALPLSALTESSRGIWAVYVAVEGTSDQASLERRQVELVHFEDEQVYVAGTLSAGEQVVTSGLHRLVPGQAVTIADKEN